jgi:hypothetical protein
MTDRGDAPKHRPAGPAAGRSAATTHTKDARMSALPPRIGQALASVTIVCVVAAIFRLAAPTPDRTTSVEDSAKIGVTVRGECPEARLPDDRPATDDPVPDTREAVQKYPGSVEKNDIWYVAVFEAHLADGSTRLMTVVRHPGNWVDHLTN